ncbi:PfkB domain-containing protein [Haematococcus lacustris]|uniref:PfkB domain-containing protein n=1 Tax=Haematococcus lacustris TaxID=44745 RepID=A0A699Z7X9_HAELA|nr:PfkB domain-containing protein [Haematococcus lacustris]
MRTFLHPGGVLRAADVEERAFSAASSGVGGGVSWVFLSAYLAYSPGLMQRCVHLAHRCGRRVALDLASFEVVRTFWPDLLALLAAGAVDVCVCNEVGAADALGTGAAAPATCSPTASSLG